MRSGRSILLWGAAALAAAALGFWLSRELHSTSPQLASGTWLPQARQLTELALTDERGVPFTLAQLRGKPALVFFGFTHCPDVCPTTLAMLANASKAAGIKDLRVLLVSVDPARDTPAVLEQYVHAFDADFKGVTGAQGEIDKMTRQFSVAVQRVDLPNGDYTMDHSSAVFLVNDEAQLVAVFTAPIEPAALAEDLRNVASDLSSG